MARAVRAVHLPQRQLLALVQHHQQALRRHPLSVHRVLSLSRVSQVCQLVRLYQAITLELFGHRFITARQQVS